MKKGLLKRLFAAIFLGKMIKSLYPPDAVSSGMGQSMLDNILAGSGIQASISFLTAKAASIKAASSSTGGIVLASSTLVVTSGVIYTIASITAPVVIPPIHVYINPADGYVNTYANVTVEIEDPLTPLAVHIVDENNQTIGAIQQEKHADNQQYVFQIEKNSTYHVLVTISDDQTAQQEFTITCLDKDFPYIDSYQLKENKLSIFLNDATSGIDFEQVYFIDHTGQNVYPDEIWPEENLAVFLVPYPEENEQLNLELYLCDNAGNQSRSVIHVFLTETPSPESDAVE